MTIKESIEYTLYLHAGNKWSQIPGLSDEDLAFITTKPQPSVRRARLALERAGKLEYAGVSASGRTLWRHKG